MVMTIQTQSMGNPDTMSTELSPLVHTIVIIDEQEPLDSESSIMLKQKSRLVKAGSFLAVMAMFAIGLSFLGHSQNSANVELVDVDSLFADLLAMAPPDGPITSWKDCKVTGKEIAVECYNLNPVDLKECEARGKEAAKACYKKMGKEYKAYKDYYKNKGEEYKDFYKTPPDDSFGH